MTSFRPSRAIPLRTLLFALALPTVSNAQDYAFTTFAGDAGYGSRDGTGNAARFNLPGSVAVDAEGNVYVADTGNHTIRKVTAEGAVTTLAGLPGTSGSKDGVGIGARFTSPNGVAVDDTGNVYVADTGNHTIRKVTTAGVVTIVAGYAGSSGAADGVGPIARFNNPIGVAADGSGTLFVADTDNHVIRKITADGVVSTFAGEAGTFGHEDGTGSAARFDHPRGVAVDRNGNVFVADHPDNWAIRKITSAGVVTTPTTSGEWSDNFSYVAGLAVDAHGNLFLAGIEDDGLFVFHAIRRISVNGGMATLAGSWGSGNADGTGAAAEFSYPTAVAVDGNGNVFVADTNNHTIRKITTGGVVTTFAGDAGYGSKDSPGSAARFYEPYGVTVDSGGNVFVADRVNSTIRKITANGVVTTLAGSARSYGSSDGAGSTAQFFYPTGVAADANGNAFVADTFNNTIRKVTANGVVTTVAGMSNVGFGSADGAGSAARFSFPTAVAVDGSSNVFVADTTNHAIRKITVDGVVTTLAGSYYASGVAADSSGNVFIADTGTHTIRKIAADGIVTVLAGSSNSGDADGPGGAARFSSPSGVAVDASGNVFVADSGNHTIRKITPAGVVTTVAGLAGVIGNADGSGPAVRFNRPWGVAVDASGNLYVADTGNHTIRKGVPVPLVAPSITTQPQSHTIAPGRIVAFNAGASANPAPVYQWFKDGSALPGETGATLILTGVTAASGGIYHCIATNAAGSASSTSAMLTVGEATGEDDSWFINLSVRALLGASQRLIAGLVTSGERSLLLRAVGPGLQPFLPDGTITVHDPRLELHEPSGLVQINDDWADYPALASASVQTGAFPLAFGSADAAILSSFDGNATLHFLPSNPGMGLIEAYATGAGGQPRLLNLSARAPVGTGDHALVVGFVIAGTGAKTLLVRGVGPTLAAAPFNLPDTLVDPRLEVFDRFGQLIAARDDAPSDLAGFAAQVGAFALPMDSKDAAVLLTLQPGVYTVLLSGVNGTTGEGLLEIYEVQ